MPAVHWTSRLAAGRWSHCHGIRRTRCVWNGPIEVRYALCSIRQCSIHVRNSAVHVWGQRGLHSAQPGDILAQPASHWAQHVLHSGQLVKRWERPALHFEQRGRHSERHPDVTRLPPPPPPPPIISAQLSLDGVATNAANRAAALASLVMYFSYILPLKQCSKLALKVTYSANDVPKRAQRFAGVE